MSDHSIMCEDEDRGWLRHLAPEGYCVCVCSKCWDHACICPDCDKSQCGRGGAR